MSIMTIKIAKLNTTVDFDVESLPPASIEYAIRYGLTQSLNDVHASVRRKDYADGAEGDAAFAHDVGVKVDTRSDQIRDGNVPGTRTVANPTETKARKFVADLLKAGHSLEEIAAFAERMTMAKAA